MPSGRPRESSLQAQHDSGNRLASREVTDGPIQRHPPPQGSRSAATAAARGDRCPGARDAASPGRDPPADPGDAAGPRPRPRQHGPLRAAAEARGCLRCHAPRERADGGHAGGAAGDPAGHPGHGSRGLVRRARGGQRAGGGRSRHRREPQRGAGLAPGTPPRPRPPAHLRRRRHAANVELCRPRAGRPGPWPCAGAACQPGVVSR